MAGQQQLAIRIIASGGAQVQRESAKARAGLAGITVETGKLNKATSAWSSVAAQQRRNLSSLTTGLRRAGLAFGALAGYMIYDGVKAGVEFEKQMARVEAVTGATGKEMSRMSDLALKLGADTKFSASEASDAMYELAAAGFEASDMGKVLPGTLSLAAASNIELADAAEISSNALRGFGLANRESEHVADVMAEAVNRSTIEMQDLQLTMKYIGPVAKATGQSFEEMIGAVAIMGDAGIKGQQAGTTLRAAMLSLTKPVGQAVEGLKMLGLNAKDLQGPNGLLPLPEIVSKLQKGTEGLSTAERNAAYSMIFGREAASGMFAVIDAGPKKLEKLGVQFEKSGGAADKAAKKMNSTVLGAFDQLTGSIETVEIRLFQQFEKPLAETLMQASRLVNREGKELVEFFDNITSTQEFKRGDLATRIELLWDGVKPAIERGVDEVIPTVANAVAEGVPKVADAFVDGFRDANVWGRILIGGLAIQKLGLTSTIFRVRGAEDAAAYSQSFISTARAAAPAQRVYPTLLPAKDTFTSAGGQAGNALVGGLNTGFIGAVGKTEGTVKRALGSRLGQTALGVGKGILGVNLAFGLAAGFTSEAPKLEGRLQDSLSAISFGLIPTWEQDAEKITQQFARGLEEGFEGIRLEGLSLDSTVSVISALQPLEKGINRGLIPSLRNLAIGQGKAIERTNDMRQALKKLRDEGDISSEQFDALSDSLDSAWDVYDRGSRKVYQFKQDIKSLRRGSVFDLNQLEDNVTDNMRKIEGSLGRHSKQGRRLIQRNFDAAVVAVKRAMREKWIATDEGAAMIRDLIRKNLSMYGIKGADAEKIVKARDGQDVRGLATGGIATVPGTGKEDNVPLSINGRVAAMTMPGEEVAVINRHQRREIDFALANTFGDRGLDSFFARKRTRHDQGAPPPMAGGGLVQALGNFDIPPIRYDANHAGSNSHLHLSFSSVGAAKAFARRIEPLGWVASESPWAGGVTVKHMDPGHYSGAAFDANAANESRSAVAKVAALLGGKGAVAGIAAAKKAMKLKLPRFDSPYAAHVDAAVGLNRIAAAMEKEIPDRAGGVMVRGGKNIKFTPGGTTVKGRATWFTGGTMASGKHTDRDPGIALNPNPGGPDPGSWNNPTTRGWLAEEQRFLVKIGRKQAVLPVLDMGPAGWTGNAIDVNLAGVKAMGYSTSNFPSGTVGTATIAKARGGLLRMLAEGGLPSATFVGRVPLKNVMKRMGKLNRRTAEFEELVSITEQWASQDSSPGGAEYSDAERKKLLKQNVKLRELLKTRAFWAEYGLDMAGRKKKRLQSRIGEDSKLAREMNRRKDRLAELRKRLKATKGDKARAKLEKQIEREEKEVDSLKEKRTERRDKIRRKIEARGSQIDKLQSWLEETVGVTGKGGQLNDVKLEIDRLRHEETVQEEDTRDEEIALLREQLEQQRRMGAVSQSQYAVFREFFAGAFAKGGVTPMGSRFALVGERGPELAQLPGGTRIYPNDQSRQMLGGGNVIVNVEADLYLDGAVVQRGVQMELKKVTQRATNKLPTRGTRVLTAGGRR